MLRKPPSLTICETLAVTAPTPETVSARTGAPVGSSSDLAGPAGFLHILHSHSQTRFPYCFHPEFPIAEPFMSWSIKQFIHSVVTQKQLELVPLRREPPWRNCWAFIPSQSQHAQVSLFPCPLLLLCLLVSMHLPGATCAICYEKGWQFMASWLSGLPHRAQSADKLQLANQGTCRATCSRCILQHGNSHPKSLKTPGM